MKGLLAGIAAAAALAAASPAVADVCHDWLDQHAARKAEVVGHYLRGAPGHALDGALFEMLQLEAYLTSCELPERVTRCQLVGWRLPGLAADEYGSAVLESLLADAGFDVSLRSVVGRSPRARDALARR